MSTPNIHIPLIVTPDPEVHRNGAQLNVLLSSYADMNQVNAALAVIDAAAPVTARSTVSAAQMKLLKTTPVTLIPAPGANLGLAVMLVVVEYKAGHVAYTGIGASTDPNTDDVLAIYTGAQPTDSNDAQARGNVMVLGPGLDLPLSTTNTVVLQPNNYLHMALTSLSNQALMLARAQNADSQLASGDGTLAITIVYQLIAL